MLENIRKAADTLIMRILLGMLALAFVWWGVKDISPSTQNVDLVKFSHSPNITKDDFLQAKSEEIHLLQTQSGIHLSEKEIEQLNIDNLIIKNLITKRMIGYLVNHYNLDISEGTLIQFIKESNEFKNKDGLFDLELFKTFLSSAHINEQEYLQNLKEGIRTNSLINIFLDSFTPPKAIIQNIISHMAEKRVVDIIQIDLENQPKDVNFPALTEDELNDFYKKNENLFEIPQKRSFVYIKIPTNSLEKKNINNEDLINFYNENKEKFDNKDFNIVKKDVEELLLQQQTEEFTSKLIKDLDDLVAAGSNLNEIAIKYQVPIQDMELTTYKNLAKNNLFSQMVDNIFELSDGELSYPLEASDKNNLILIEIKTIQASKIPEFVKIKDQVQKLAGKQYLKNLNLAKIESFAQSYKTGKNIKSPESIVNKQLSLTKYNLQDNQLYPPELLIACFQADINTNTPVFQAQNKAFFAHINSISIDKEKNKEVEKTQKDNIIKLIKNNLFEELINYAIKKNEMEIK